MFSAHVTGCSFYYMYQTEKQQKETWVSRQDLLESDWTEKYITALYFSVITMITVGYGDIVPTNSEEKIFVIFITLVSCGIFAYSVNQIGSIVEKLTQKGMEMDRKMSLLTTYLKKRGVNLQLQLKVQKYFEYLNKDPNLEDEVGDSILQSLVGNLRKEVLVEIYGKLLKSQKVFKLNFSEELLNELALEVKEVRLEPQRIIYDHQNPCEQIYFLMDGEVEEFINIYQNNQFKKIKTLKRHEVFNQKQFFSDNVQNYGAITKTVVTLGYLSKQSLVDILDRFPDDKQIYQSYKDRLNFDFTTNGLQIQCQSCLQYGHDILQCQYSQYVPNRLQIINKFNNQQEIHQDREPFERSYQYKVNTLENMYTIRDMGLQYIIDQTDIEDLDLLQNLQYIQQAHQQYDLFGQNLSPQYLQPKNSINIQQSNSANNIISVYKEGLSPIESYSQNTKSYHSESQLQELRYSKKSIKRQIQRQSEILNQLQNMYKEANNNSLQQQKNENLMIKQCVSQETLSEDSVSNDNNSRISQQTDDNFFKIGGLERNSQISKKSYTPIQQQQLGQGNLSAYNKISDDQFSQSQNSKQQSRNQQSQSQSNNNTNQKINSNQDENIVQQEQLQQMQPPKIPITKAQTSFSNYEAFLGTPKNFQYQNSCQLNQQQQQNQIQNRIQQGKMQSLTEIPLDGKVLQLLKEKMNIKKRRGGNYMLLKRQSNSRDSYQKYPSRFSYTSSNKIISSQRQLKNNQQVNQQENSDSNYQNSFRLSKNSTQSPIKRTNSKQFTNLRFNNYNQNSFRRGNQQFQTLIMSPIEFLTTNNNNNKNNANNINVSGQQQQEIQEMEKEIQLEKYVLEQLKWSEIDIDQYRIWNLYFVKYNINVVLENINKIISKNMDSILTSQQQKKEDFMMNSRQPTQMMGMQQQQQQLQKQLKTNTTMRRLITTTNNNNNMSRYQLFASSSQSQSFQSQILSQYQ